MGNELPEKMRFADPTGAGGPEVLRIGSMALPEPREHEVLIKVHAAGINRPDVLQRQGKYAPPPGASPVMGLEIAGEVAALGRGATLKLGTQACALVPGGGYAEYCRVPESHCLPIPKGLSLLQAAGIPETYSTVWANVFQIGHLASGERFLVHGGAGGIGTTAIQLAHARGAEVFTTAGSDEKCAACRQLGADHAFNYKTTNFSDEIAKITDGRGVDVILDMIGGPYTEKNIDSLAMQGRLVQIAFQQGAKVTLNIAKIMQKRLVLTGSTLRPRSIEDKTVIANELKSNVWPLLESGKIKVIVDKVFAFDELQAAHEYFDSAQHTGKVILEMIA